MKSAIRIFLTGTLLLAFLIFTKCEKPQTYPDTPSVSFVKMLISDTVDVLKNKVILNDLYFELVDGNGDVGLRTGDTTGKFNKDSLHYHNLFVQMYNKKNGKTDSVKLQVPLKYRIPYIKPSGQNKYLKAEVKVKIEFPISTSTYDTVFYEFYIYDQAFNKSNLISTPKIPWIYRGWVKPDFVK